MGRHIYKNLTVSYTASTTVFGDAIESTEKEQVRIIEVKPSAHDTGTNKAAKLVGYVDQEKVIDDVPLYMFGVDAAAGTTAITPVQWVEVDRILKQGEKFKVGFLYGSAEPTKHEITVHYEILGD